MTARNPLPSGLIDKLLADHKKLGSFIGEEGLLTQLTGPSTNKPSMPK